MKGQRTLVCAFAQGMEDEKARDNVRACCFLVGFHVPESTWTAVMQPWMHQGGPSGAIFPAANAVWQAMQQGCSAAEQQEAL